MARGGARNRSGPAPDPDSGRSDRRGYSLTALPSEGYDGPVPEFSLPQASARELEVWERVWRTPQACAWSMPSESWRVSIDAVAFFVRQKVRCEALDAPTSLIAQLPRLEDRVGFSTAGLAEMGWRVVVDEVSTQRSRPTEDTPRPSSRDRLKAVGDGGD